MTPWRVQPSARPLALDAGAQPRTDSKVAERVQRHAFDAEPDGDTVEVLSQPLRVDRGSVRYPPQQFRTSLTGPDGMVSGQKRRSPIWSQPRGRILPPCQGGGRGFESRRPLVGGPVRALVSCPGRLSIRICNSCGSGGVAEWLGKGLQNPVHRFNSGPRLGSAVPCRTSGA
jgi:hypothetical protein